MERRSQKNAKEINLPLPFAPAHRRRKASQADCSLGSQEPIPSRSTSALQLLGKSSPSPRARAFRGLPLAWVTSPFTVWEQQREPRRGAGSPETCCQQPGQLAGNVGGSLQMPRKPPSWVPLRHGGDPGITRALWAASGWLGGSEIQHFWVGKSSAGYYFGNRQS